MKAKWYNLRQIGVLFGLFSGLWTIGIQAQQVANRPAFGELSYLWNPAMTAMGESMEVSMAYRRQWAGFDGSPKTAMLGVQVPLMDQQMSLGGFFNHDEIQPMVFNQIGMTYAYRFRPGLGQKDRLAIGLAGMVNQQLFDGLDLVVNDPDDNLVPGGELNQFDFNAAAGFLYLSNASDLYGKSSFYFGAAVTGLIPGSFDYSGLGSAAKYENRLHANAVIGVRIVRDVFLIEPSVWVDYAQQNLFNTHLGIRLEMIETFWAGLDYSSANLMSFQAGVYFRNVLTRDGLIKAGTRGSFNMGDIAATRGSSYDFYVGYQYMF